MHAVIVSQKLIVIGKKNTQTLADPRWSAKGFPVPPGPISFIFIVFQENLGK